MLTEQRKIFRNHGAKKEFLEIIQSSNFDLIYENIDKESKKNKENAEKIKEELKQKKSEQRKTRKNTEKIINELFRLKQEIENKSVDLQRLSSECDALQNKQQKHFNDITNNNKYDIQQLITEESCKNIINEQQEILNKLINDTTNYKQQHSTQKTKNNQFNKEYDILNKKRQTFKDLLSMRNNSNLLQNNQQNEELKALQNNLESMKRLLSIKKLKINNDQLLIEFESASNQIYKIQIEMNVFQCNENDETNIDYHINNVQIVNNNTKYNEIVDYVLTKYKKTNETDDGLIAVSMISLKKIVMEILCILKKLPLRYKDITKLYEIYNGKQDMIPWFPESDELVSKFKFKQKVVMKNVNNDENDDDDQKMSDLSGNGMTQGMEKEIMIDIPLVISVSWNYPQHRFIRDTEVISIQGYNCSLSDKNDMMNMMEIEQKWKEVLEETVNEVSGKFQNDIIGFVNFIHDKLQRFADTNQS